MLDVKPTLIAKEPKLQFDFKFGLLFPWTFRFLGALAAGGSVFPLLNFNWFGLPLLVFGLVIMISYEGVEIDHLEKTYREYTSWLVFKTGNWVTYDAIEKVYIKKKVETQKMYSAHTSKSATFSREVFDAYLKFESGEKVLLLSKKSKADLLKRFEGFTKSVGIPLVDNT